MIPGTFGSLAGIVLYYFTGQSIRALLAAAAVVTLAGWWASGRMERIAGRKDPSCIVIDEVSGMLISLLFIPYDPKFVVIAFLVFRILDTLKPYPAGGLQRIRGSTGIMIDDVVAGIYTNCVLQAVVRLVSIRGS